VHGCNPGYPVELANIARYIVNIEVEEASVDVFLSICREELRETQLKDKLNKNWRLGTEQSIPVGTATVSTRALAEFPNIK
jgi:hypothetical protein